MENGSKWGGVQWTDTECGVDGSPAFEVGSPTKLAQFSEKLEPRQESVPAGAAGRTPLEAGTRHTTPPTCPLPHTHTRKQQKKPKTQQNGTEITPFSCFSSRFFFSLPAALRCTKNRADESKIQQLFRSVLRICVCVSGLLLHILHGRWKPCFPPTNKKGAQLYGQHQHHSCRCGRHRNEETRTRPTSGRRNVRMNGTASKPVKTFHEDIPPPRPF